MNEITDIIEISHVDYLKVNKLQRDRFRNEKIWIDFVCLLIGEERMKIINSKGLSLGTVYTFSENGYTNDPTDKKFLCYSFFLFSSSKLQLPKLH